MINTNLFTIFPIYDSLEMQNQYKYIDERGVMLNDVCTFKLHCTKERLLPFQFRRTPSVATLTHIYLVCYNQEYSNDILPDIPVGQIDYATADGWDYITYYGTDDLDEDLPCGDFYLQIEDGNGIWYSEVFHVSEDTVMPDDYRITRMGEFREWANDELRIWR